MKILNLHSENVMRLRAVDVTPGAATVVVGGRNAQGKSSVLRSIEIALGGKDSAPRAPVRIGEGEANVVVDLGDMIVRRRITADGRSTLAVESREGAVFKSPQALLDKLVGQLSFDPLAFSRMKPREAADVLCKLVGLDLSGFRSERQRVYDERTAVNRTLKTLEHRLAEMPNHEDAPAEPVSVAEIGEELKAAQEEQRSLEVARRRANDAKVLQTKQEAEIARLAEEIERLITRRGALLEGLQEISAATSAADAEYASALSTAPNLDDIHARLAAAAQTNEKVSANAERSKRSAEVDEVKAQASAMTAQIEKIDAEKIAAVTGAKFPIDGLSIDDDGVTLNGVPFEQSSSAEQLRASVAIGIAMNPKLRVLLVRDGSLLDDDGLRLLGELAAEHDAQVWVERVAVNREGCTVFIEDGAVQADEAAPNEAIAQPEAASA